MKRLKGAPRERDFLALDTEDDQLGYGASSGFYLGCVYTPAGPHVFKQRWRVIRFLSRNQWAGYWCGCHNLEYDMLNVFGPENVCLMDPCFSGSRLVGLRLRLKPGKGPKSFLHFFDTGAFFSPTPPLAKLAPMVGLEKFDMEHVRGQRKITKKHVDYCVQDTRIVYELACFIQRGVNALGAEMKLTAAATALDCWRRNYQYGEIPCLPEETQDDLHKGYCGGRVECFKLGDFKRKLYGNDFNGMYVSVMIDGNLPEIGTFAPKKGLDLAREGMAHVRLEVPEHLWAGPLPVKDVKLTFPIGKLEGWWCFNELRTALNFGVKIGKVFRSFYSTRCEPYLRDMMLKLRAKREDPKTTEPESNMAKVLGNSLYGKFAQRNENFFYMKLTEFNRATREHTLPDFDAEKTQIYDTLNLVRVVQAGDYPRHSNVIWSACITAGARNKLYAHIDQDTSYYCDTDSILGEKGYPVTKRLGALALDRKYSRLVIRGNKLYAGFETSKKWNAHAKGVPRDRALDAVLKPGVKIVSRRPVKLRSALRGQAAANAWIEVFKRLSAEYDKREVLPSGDTRPLRRKDW